MKVQKSKLAGLKAARFELKRMELLRYHNDLHTRSDGSVWLSILPMLLFAATPPFAPEMNLGNKKKENTGKEKE